MTGEKVVLITGCSSGIGYSTALFLAHRGFQVYATMRNPSNAGALLKEKEGEELPIEILKLDVTDEKTIKSAVKKIIREKGRIDILINNAGFGVEGPIEKIPMDDLYSVFEKNFFGLVMLTKEVLPHMLRAGSGRIVNVSSAAGKISIPFFSAYCSSKYAVEGFSESLRHELEPRGIKVVLIEPGVVNTNFYKNTKRVSTASGGPIYTDYFKESTFEHGKGILPEKVAEVVQKAVTSSKPKMRYTAGRDAWAGTFFRKVLPERVFLWGVRKHYIKKNR